METIVRSPKTLGTALKNARTQTAKTQGELGADIGMWQETISGIETGKSTRKLEAIFDILAALDLELVVRSRSNSQEPVLFEEIF